MIQKTINLYTFKELSEEAKETVIENHYENEQYEFLLDNLLESLKYKLNENDVEYNNLKLFYSLSYSQGDGLSFTGDFEYKNKSYSIVSTGNRYEYATSKNIVDNELDEYIEDGEFYDIYIDICTKLEKEGYSIMKYRMSNEEFEEYSNDMELVYEEDGTLY